VSRRTLVKPTAALVLPLLAGLASCASSSKQSESLRQADDLVTRVERVHVECELAKDSVHEAVDWLQAIIRNDYEGDAMSAFGGFMESVEKSEKQAKTLRAAVAPMQRTAQSFFDGWTADLNAFANPRMRQRSQAKLTQARQRYDAVAAAVDPAETAFDAFNLGLRDIALFLSHDFGSASELKPEARSLMRMTKELDQSLDATLAAAQQYIQDQALPAGVEAVPEGIKSGG
jgi:Protein of unknown function (DUF2959)